MTNTVTVGLTHAATFKTKKPGFFEFAMNSEILVNPEDSGFGILPVIVAGLEPKDIIRITIFAGEKEAEIRAFFGISDNCKELNKQARETLERFAESIQSAGYVTEPISFVKIDPASGRPAK